MSDPDRDPSATTAAATAPVVVKKYANRRLYNTESSSYITLENLAEMIRKGRDFVVFDAKSGEDITRQVLTQIIVEEEGKGTAMLPISFLRQLIGMYGEDMQGLVPRYLEQAMNVFAQQQEKLRSTMQETMGKLIPPLSVPIPTNLEEIGRQNIAMMERAMSLFSPFYRPASPTTAPQQETTQSNTKAGLKSEPKSPQDASAELTALREEVETLRRELAAAQSAIAKNAKSRGSG